MAESRDRLRYLKLVSGIVLLLGAVFCSSNPGRVKRIRENGVEVVLNNIEPYRQKGVPSTFSLRTVLTIDTEREDLAKVGMGSAGEFGVDAAGDIFIVGFKNQSDFIYRFNSRGLFLNSLGRRGQGPGELQWPFLDAVLDDGRVALTDLMDRYIVFDAKGNLVKEFHPRTAISYVFPLANGKMLVEGPRPGETLRDDAVMYGLSLCDSDFKEIKLLDEFPFFFGNKKMVPFFMYRVTAGHIYIANERRGYEIWDFDYEGKLRRKIRKDFRPAPVTEEIKEAILGPDYRRSGVSHDGYFPNPLPPLSLFFVDDTGRLFVLTYEAGDRPGEYLCDIFTSDGVFVGRKSLDLEWAGLYGGPKYFEVRGGLLYRYKEKQSGFQELLVQRMNWE